MRIIITISILLVAVAAGMSQSYWFGPKGGASLGIQRWNGYERQPLIAGHGGFFIETYDEEKELGSLYASIGLHQRGSSVRSRFTFQNQQVSGIKYIFNNISLQLGAKKFYNASLYYLFGLRAEYTAWTNLQELSERFNNSAFFPLDEFVRPITGGATIGGGWQYDLSEFYGMSIEFTINPDFFNQYRSGEFDTLSPFSNQPVTVRASEIRNTTIELTVAFRFLRKIEYID